MSETQNMFEQFDKKQNRNEIHTYEENIESFTIGAEEAAQILGVNRSRLSQLTSKGVFTYERRKIDTRNRLFYKLSEILNHQRSQFQGNQFHNSYIEKPVKYQTEENIEFHENNNYSAETVQLKKRNLKNQTNSKVLFSAKTIFLSEQNKEEKIETKKNIHFIKEKSIQNENLIQSLNQYNLKKEHLLQKMILNNKEVMNQIQLSMFQLNSDIKQLQETLKELNTKFENSLNKPIKKWKIKKTKFLPKSTASR